MYLHRVSHATHTTSGKTSDSCKYLQRLAWRIFGKMTRQHLHRQVSEIFFSFSPQEGFFIFSREQILGELKLGCGSAFSLPLRLPRRLLLLLRLAASFAPLWFGVRRRRRWWQGGAAAADGDGEVLLSGQSGEQFSRLWVPFCREERLYRLNPSWFMVDAGAELSCGQW